MACPDNALPFSEFSACTCNTPCPEVLLSRYNMADTFLERRNILVSNARLSAEFYGPYLVGHALPSSSIRDGGQRVMYARQGIALGKGSFGQIYPEYAQNDCPGAPPVRAVKEINKSFLLQQKLDWEREVEAMIVLTQSEVSSDHIPPITYSSLEVRARIRSYHSMAGMRTTRRCSLPWNTCPWGTSPDISTKSRPRMT